MQIVQSSRDRLTMVYRPVHMWIQSVLCLGMTFFIAPHSSSLAFKAMAAIACVLGAAYLVWYCGDIVTSCVDKHRGIIRVHRSGLRGNRMTDYALDQVTSVLVAERLYRRKGFRRIYVYWVILQTTSHQQVKITSCAFHDRHKACSVAWTLSDFLNLGPYAMTEYRPTGWLF